MDDGAAFIDPASPPLRDRTEVRRRVDEKLGAGLGLSTAEANEKLNPVERVDWIVGELLANLLEKKLHLWVQGWCSGTKPDGPAAIARIAEAGRRLDPVVADLLRWTAFRAVSRPGGLFTVVPEVWNGRWTGFVPQFLEALVARWPEDLDPLSLPEPPLWSRTVVAPSEREPRYPQVRVGLTEAARDCLVTAPPNPDLAAEAVAFGLWRGGASDAELDEYYHELGNSGDRLPELFVRWVAVDGRAADAAARERLRALYHPRHPLEIETGAEKLAWPSLVLLAADRLEPVCAALAEWRSIRIRPTRDISFADCVSAALRADPDTLIVDARDLSASDARTLAGALYSGHLVVACGPSPVLEMVASEAASGGCDVLRR